MPTMSLEWLNALGTWSPSIVLFSRRPNRLQFWSALVQDVLHYGQLQANDRHRHSTDVLSHIGQGTPGLKSWQYKQLLHPATIEAQN